MLVIADSSPLIALVNIGHIDVLPKLFGSVAIPPRVAEELASAKRPQAVRDFISRPPTWLSVRKPSSVEPISGIHAGEREAISLAREIEADLLIIDDRRGRRAAIQRNIRTARTIAVLEEAADRRLINLNEAFDRLRRTDFRVSERLLSQILKRHGQRPPLDS
jgi:predicted nucleic acid-binding protein